jgi:hypothetical protein
MPIGVALDRAAGRIYWANFHGDTISYANLDGSGGGDLNTTGASVLGPRGLALDPPDNRVYWANPVAGTISYANLDGTGGGDDLDLPKPPGGSFPVFPVLFKTPSATERPEVSGQGSETSGALASAKSKVGRKLSCSTGSWSGDLLGAFLYRAPQGFAYQWRRNGTEVPGATRKAFTPKKPGSYRCRVKASNEVGSSSKKSRPVKVIQPSACKKAKKRLKKAKKALKKAKASDSTRKVKKAKKRLRKAKKAKKRTC